MKNLNKENMVELVISLDVNLSRIHFTDNHRQGNL